MVFALAVALQSSAAWGDTILDSETGTSPVANAKLRGGTRYRHLTAEAFSETATVVTGRLEWRCGERNARGDFQIRVSTRERIDDSPYSLTRRVPAFVRNRRRADAYCNMRIWIVGEDDTGFVVESTARISASRQ
jgi:hypothetical protein